MKKLFFTALILSAVASSSQAQGQMDAYRFSKNDLRGTARSIGMGGAFGALGGDIAGIAINPAGIGVYKSSEIVTTLNFENRRTETDNYSGKLTDSRFRFSFDNVAFVGAFPVNSDVTPFVNFGFSYNRLKSFNNSFQMQGHFLQNSITDYMAVRAEDTPASRLSITDRNNPFTNGSDWMAVLGFNGFLIDPINGSNPTPGANGYTSVIRSLNQPNMDNYLFVRESGGINSYDFNIGTTFADMLSFGVTFAVTDINYNLYSDYSEDVHFVNSSGNDDYYSSLFLENWSRINGTGYQVKAGLIFKPVNEIRIGAAYHSPTWYNMTEFYSALLEDLDGKIIDTFDRDNAGNAFFDYRLRTPDRWTFSLATIIAKKAILSADYELANYGRMNLQNRNGFNLTRENQNIREDFRTAGTLRLGAEMRFTPQISARVGYAWMQTPFEAQARSNETNQIETKGTVHHFIVDGNVNHFTYGFGYRFSRNFYTDIAFVIKTQKDQLYNFENIPAGSGANVDAEVGTLRTNTFQGLITFGYRY